MAKYSLRKGIPILFLISMISKKLCVLVGPCIVYDLSIMCVENFLFKALPSKIKKGTVCSIFNKKVDTCFR